MPVAGKPMIEHVLDNLCVIQEIKRVAVVTNHKFAKSFEDWAAGYQGRHPNPVMTIVNDGSTEDGNRLGAIGDLSLAITRGSIDDDLVVVASDNLFSRSLEAFGTFCRQRKAPVVALYDVGNLEEITKYNSITVDDTGRITFFEEKPKHPSSTRTAIALYYYPRSVLPFIKRYLAEGNNPDQPGRLIQWLYPQMAVYTWDLPGTWFDVGSAESLEEANRVFGALKP